MEEEARNRDDRHGHLLEDFEKEAKDEPELAAKLEAVDRAMKRYKEALQRLADS
jgi:hypothetical protein